MSKQSLQLHLKQHLRLTPQLQQTIQLLQLPTIDLRLEIQRALETNPLLELAEEENTDPLILMTELSPSDTALLSATFENKEIPAELPFDTSWDDVYHPAQHTDQTDILHDPFAHYSEISSMKYYLLEQVLHEHFNHQELLAAQIIIDHLTEDGLLAISTHEIQSQLTPAHAMSEAEILNVLQHIQQFDPPGIAARDLKECLLIQLSLLPASAEKNIATAMMTDHFHLLEKHDYQTLIKIYRLTMTELNKTLRLIQSLNPRPASQFANLIPYTITPDLIVTKKQNTWQIALNALSLPTLKINALSQSYLLKTKQSSLTDYEYIRSKLIDAQSLLKSIEQRNATLLLVASCVMQEQQRFLEKGETAMRPLVLSTIANQLSLHESTISRACHGKYIATPHGTFELKYFFNTSLQTETGTEISATALRALIREIIEDEPPEQPFSDLKIANIIKQLGVVLSRRTITKYREILKIPSSHERKQAIFPENLV